MLVQMCFDYCSVNLEKYFEESSMFVTQVILNVDFK